MLQILSTSNETSTGTELVQNGNFSELGSDLVQNGDFAEVGSDLITNGDFATDSNWTLGTGWSIGEDKVIVAPSGVNTYLDQNFTGVNGNFYKITYEVLSNSLVGGTHFSLSGSSLFGGYALPETIGIHTVYLEATNDTSSAALKIFSGSSSGSLSFTNISVKEVGEGWNLNSPPFSVVSNGIASDGTSTADANHNLYLKFHLNLFFQQ